MRSLLSVVRLDTSVMLGLCLPFFISSCSKPTSPEEILARQKCASCHEFPEPALASKQFWGTGILPKMAELMHVNPADSLSKAEFDAITRYYLTEAPDHIEFVNPSIRDSITQFEYVPIDFKKKLISLIRYDSTTNSICIADWLGNFYFMDKKFAIKDSIKFPNAPVAMERHGNDLYVLCAGSLPPRDDINGKFFKHSDETTTELIDSLKRPVFFQRLEENGVEKFLISSFGHTTGSLDIFSRRDSLFLGHTLDALPGARKTVAVDWDNDGRKDILALMAQGDERLLLFRNTSNGYEKKVLLRFPPIHGSSNFEVADFNGDGHPDVIMTNGDNADLSPFVKPYHGIRIYLNDEGALAQKWVTSMPGATDIKTIDFDSDGDLDFVATSFFPDNVNTPLQNLIYFENQGELKFKPHIHEMSERGKWLVMEALDIDDDGDQDILLGSFQFTGLGYNYRVDPKDQIYLLLLRNKTR